MAAHRHFEADAMTANVLSALGEKPTVTTGRGLQRAEEILLAARDIMLAEGYAGLTMRGVATRINVNLSTVQHYYKNLEVLVEALLAWQIDSFGHGIATAIAAVADKSQQERLEAVLDYLLDECREPAVCGIFAEAWALGKRLPFAMRLMEQVEERERKQFYKLIQGLNPAINRAEYRRRAAMIVMLLNGLMLQFPVQGTPALSRKQLESAVRAQVLQLAAAI
jgi:AcrR family transcriptional regulator